MIKSELNSRDAAFVLYLILSIVLDVESLSFQIIVWGQGSVGVSA